MALATRPKPTTTHRKRSGNHHRHSKQYLKHYWPYLPMLFIVGAGLFVNSLLSTQHVLGATSDYSALTLLDSTNAARATDKETGLTIDPALTNAAQAKANDMVANNYWSHTSPSGKTPWDFITAAGYNYQEAGENLAYGFSSGSAVITGWMNSTEHRANILNNDYINVGFGVASSPDFQGRGPETIVVAEYADPAADAANISFTVPNSPQPVATATSSAPTELSAQPVSRIQLLTGGNAAWAGAAMSAILGAAIAVFVVRHGFRLKRLINRGELFIARHPMLDIGVVLIATVAFVLTRSGGIIR